MSELSGKVHITELWPRYSTCHLCDDETLAGYGIAIYEDLIVPDNYQGEWGGVPVCPSCYLAVRSMQDSDPARLWTFAEARARAVVVASKEGGSES